MKLSFFLLKLPHVAIFCLCIVSFIPGKTRMTCMGNVFGSALQIQVRIARRFVWMSRTLVEFFVYVCGVCESFVFDGGWA